MTFLSLSLLSLPLFLFFSLFLSLSRYNIKFFNQIHWGKLFLSEIRDACCITDDQKHSGSNHTEFLRFFLPGASFPYMDAAHPKRIWILDGCQYIELHRHVTAKDHLKDQLQNHANGPDLILRLYRCVSLLHSHHPRSACLFPLIRNCDDRHRKD